MHTGVGSILEDMMSIMYSRRIVLPQKKQKGNENIFQTSRKARDLFGNQ
jgi:hypothetical protein